MRKVKIINKEKFLKRVVIIFSIIVFVVFCFTKISFSHNDNKKTEFVEISVEYGDSLWSISCNEQKNNPYFKNKDVREAMYQIKKFNKLSNCNLYVNQTLKIPTL